MKKSNTALLFLYPLLVFFSILTLVPFAWMICAAFKGNADFFNSLFLPGGDGLLGIAWDRLTFANFAKLFGELGMLRATMNSVFLASTTALLGTIGGAMGGYALAKFEFRGRKWMRRLVFAAMVIPGPLLMAPGYQMMYHLGLLDTYAGMILPTIAPAFGIFLFRQSILNSVPMELIEAARIDGAGEIRIFATMVLPIVRPMIGAFLMITFLGTWNNFIGPQILLQSPEKFPLSVAINSLKGVYGQDYGMLMAGTLISIAPILVLFLLLQKEFIAGLTAGSVKG